MLAVSVTKDNVIYSMIQFEEKDMEYALESFLKIASHYGADFEEHDPKETIEDGYIDCNNGYTVCWSFMDRPHESFLLQELEEIA